MRRRRIEWVVRGALVFCLLYALVALPDRRHETFPFFSWDLFSSAPNPIGTDYSVRLIAADGLTTPLPVYYERSGLQRGGQQIQGYTALQRLGQAVDRGQTRLVATLRSAFESTYLNELTHLRYEVVRRTFNIRARVDCDSCFIDQTVLGTYGTG
jgi:hypothetical protein